MPMILAISANFSFELEQPNDALLQFEVAELPDQRVIKAQTVITGIEHEARVPGESDLGERIWVRGEGLVKARHSARIEILRSAPVWERLKSVALTEAPADATAYLLDSRYCHPAQFTDFADSQFGAIEPAGARIAAIRDWVTSHVRYTHGVSDSATTSTDTFHQGQGACRDFAHLVITLARACSIPARYVACCAPGVSPQDFHAVAQVYLADPAQRGAGAWHIVDATRMADPEQTAIIGVGRDAGDVSFLTSFGPMRFVSSEVSVIAADSPGNTGYPRGVGEPEAAAA
ncbi:MAG: transglutaminase family protein [Pseudomonadota bacterium]